MEQTFIATIYDGEINSAHTCSALEDVLLQATRHPKKHNQFMPFLLSDLVECRFSPQSLALTKFTPLLQSMEMSELIYQASKVEITSVYRNDVYSPIITANAFFNLPMRRNFNAYEWSRNLEEHESLQDALQFNWIFPKANFSLDRPLFSCPEDYDMDAIGSRRIPFKPISF